MKGGNIMKFELILFMILTYLIIITVEVYPFSDDTYKNNDGFIIVFWDTDSGNIEEITDLTYPQFIKKVKPKEILTEDLILKYFWDEQLLEFDLKKYRNGANSGIIGSSSSFFTIVLNKVIIYHGISRTVIPSFRVKYDDSDYPAITNFPKNEKGTTILAFTPKFSPFDTFKDFDEKEQKKILNQEVLKYFEEKGKIIRGKMNLNEILKYYKYRN